MIVVATSIVFAAFVVAVDVAAAPVLFPGFFSDHRCSTWSRFCFQEYLKVN